MHVLINPFPIYGLAVAVVALIIALVARNRVALVTAVVLVLLSGLSAWPTYVYGEAAYDRIKAVSDTAGEQWLDEHVARGEKFIAIFYVLAGLAFIAITAPLRWPHTSVPLGAATLIMAIATLVIGSWIAYPGGHVRHKEFRFESPPPTRQPQK
jgi:glucan phosphoethanolaminetransferase (alkaline phosphatase superfamily)